MSQSDVERSKSGDSMVRDLPSFIPNDPGSPNHDLLDVIGRAVDRLDEDIELAEDASSVYNARSVDQLFELAKLVDVTPRTNETVSQYRTRVISGYQLATSEGTIEDLLNSVATIIGGSVTQLHYNEPSPGFVVVGIPTSLIMEIGIETSDISESIDKIIPAGYSGQVESRGTLLYISAEEHQAGLWDDEAGYDTLVDDEPTGLGGTKSGVLNE